LILVGLASVIIGQAVIPARAVWWATLAVVIGALIYRFVMFLALSAGLHPNDMKLISAILVVLALVLPRWSLFRKFMKWIKSLFGAANGKNGPPANGRAKTVNTSAQPSSHTVGADSATGAERG